MADTYEQNLGQKSSLTVNDYIRVVGSDNASYKQLVSDVAKKIIENYTGSSLAGSSQSVKSALDTLNSKTTLSLTRTENTHVTEANFDRLYAFKRGNLLFLNGNLSVEYGGGFTDFNEIGRISNWNALSDAYFCVPAQNDGSKVVVVQIYANGIIRIYSSTAFSGAPFFRFALCVPCA